jgi:hypothetical protein
MTRLMLFLLVGAVVLVGCVAWQHDAADEATAARAAQQAENGYRVTRAKIAARRTYVERTSERHVRTIAASDTAVAAFHLDAAAFIAPAPAAAASDTLEALMPVREVRALVATADTAIRALEVERAAANARIMALVQLTIAQDTALAAADTALARLHRLADARECRVLSLPCPPRRVTATAGFVVGLVLAWHLR